MQWWQVKVGVFYPRAGRPSIVLAFSPIVSPVSFCRHSSDPSICIKCNLHTTMVGKCLTFCEMALSSRQVANYLQSCAHVTACLPPSRVLCSGSPSTSRLSTSSHSIMPTSLESVFFRALYSGAPPHHPEASATSTLFSSLYQP